MCVTYNWPVIALLQNTREGLHDSTLNIDFCTAGDADDSTLQNFATEGEQTKHIFVFVIVNIF